ncbi:MAG: YaaA family protein, partial [Fluviicola sp.]|nr:YaaA family protein [Fluviicola sp.]
MKVIISPAKSIEYKPINIEVDFSIPHFIKETEVLAKKLKKVSSKKLSEMMHISVELSDLNFQRYQNWETPNEKKESNFPCIAG